MWIKESRELHARVFTKDKTIQFIPLNILLLLTHVLHPNHLVSITRVIINSKAQSNRDAKLSGNSKVQMWKTEAKICLSSPPERKNEMQTF